MLIKNKNSLGPTHSSYIFYWTNNALTSQHKECTVREKKYREALEIREAKEMTHPHSLPCPTCFPGNWLRTRDSKPMVMNKGGFPSYSNISADVKAGSGRGPTYIKHPDFLVILFPFSLVSLGVAI